MKLNKVFFILCVLAVTKINAQNLRLGVHATPSINYISTSQPDVETNLAVKFGFGLLADYFFAEHYAISTGVDILSSGGTMDINDTSRKYNAGYVQIPIALKMCTREFGYFTYFARFGGGIMIKTSETIDFEPDIAPGSELDSYVNPLGLTFKFGGGAEYSFGGSASLIAEIAYHRNLVDNLNSDDPSLRSNRSYRFDYVALSIGVLF